MNALLPIRLAIITLLAFAGAATAQPVNPSSRPTPPAAEAKALAEPAAGRKQLTADALPISRITLYRSGVGSFIRNGQIDGDARVQLKFDVGQINDVLKTLQVLDLSGGRVDSVSYASKDPLSRRLASFSLQVGDNPSVGVLFERLRGARVKLSTIDGEVNGTVLSTETREVAVTSGGGGATKTNTVYVNLLTATGIKSFAIPNIKDFEIVDKQLADELSRALLALSESRAERVKGVDIMLAGGNGRNIVVGYVHETPVWKTSYRLVLPDADAAPKPAADAPAKAPPTGNLQGWAIVENTTDTDWTNVRLALVSGRPVSFTMDLYEPMYATRPNVPVPTIPGVTPRQYDLAVNAPPPSPMAGAGRPGSGGGVGGDRRAAKAGVPASAARMESASSMDDGAGSILPGFGNYTPSAADMSDYAPRSQASASEVGEVFQYELQNPVTIERQRSAMLPILSAGVGSRRVSIYNRGDRSDHSMRGVELTHSSNLQLLPGPIAVFDGAAYAGDATIGQIAAGDKRLLAYAVDLDVAVATTPTDGGQITKLRIVDGSIELTTLQRQGLTYRFDNKDLKRPRTIIVEHPRFEGWDLKSPAKADEQTQSLYRFSATAEAGKAVDVSVIQERIDRQMVGIDGYPEDAIIRYRAEGKVSEAVLKAIRDVAARQADIRRQEASIESMDRSLMTLKSDQTRISTMTNSLDRTTDAYKNLLTKITKQETEIDSLTAKRADAADKLETARADFAKFVASLNVD